MGCQSSPYVNLSNLQADGCCTLLGTELQFISKDFYTEMAPYIMEQVEKAKTADKFGHISTENKALDVLMDIHMLYGYLLTVHYQRIWDAELDDPCHEDLGNKHYWDTFKFACIAKHFMCYNIDILKALNTFDINQKPKFHNGIGHMKIFKAAIPDCSTEFIKTCGSPDLHLLAQSVSLEDILVDNISIAPAPHTEANMTALLNYVKTLLEGLYPVTITITPEGDDVFDIQVCAPHGVDHPITIEIQAQYHWLPPLVQGASFTAISGTGDPCVIQWNFPFGTPIPGIARITLRDTFWTNPADDIFVAGPVFYNDMCAIAADILTYLGTAYPGFYSLVTCGGLGIRLANASCIDIIVGATIHQYIQPPEQTQDCTFVSNEIEGGHFANEPISECDDHNVIFHVS